jgi:WD40 repeat protein
MLLYSDHKDPNVNKDHKGVVYALAFSPDGTSLASGGKDGALFLRDLAGQRIPLLEGPNALPVHSLAFSPDGSVLVGGGFGWLGYRQAPSGSWSVFGPMKTTPTNALALLDESTLAVGTGDRVRPTAGTLELWDLPSGRRRSPHFMEPNGVRAIAVCPDRRMVAWATGHRKLCVWEIVKSKPIEFAQPKPCPAVALSPDGIHLAAAVDYTVKLFNVEKQQERMELRGHKAPVWTLAFSPDGNTLATGSFDQTVKFWDVATGREKTTFKWPIGRVYCLAYAPDGLRMAAGGDSGSVVIWDLDD